MTSEHTGGPWKFERDGGGTIFIFGKDQQGCTVQIGSVDDEDMGNALPALANAKLIASAPALLTELESAALALEEASKLLFAKGLQGCASIMAAHCDKARAAIAASGV